MNRNHEMENGFIIHLPTEKEPFIIVNKPKGLPSAPLKKEDRSALTLVSEEFPECLEIKGKKEVEGGLVHRLDTDTDGLLLIAVTQDFYDFIQDAQDKGLFVKTYSATCTRLLNRDDDSYPPCPLGNMETGTEYSISSYFRHYGPSRKSVRPVTEESPLVVQKKAGKTIYTTDITIKETKIMSLSDSIRQSEILCRENNRDYRVKPDNDVIQSFIKKQDTEVYYVECKINRGFRHQVRCHLAWLGLPVIGDKFYNPENSEVEMQFSATGLRFPLPRGNVYSVGK